MTIEQENRAEADERYLNENAPDGNEVDVALFKKLVKKKVGSKINRNTMKRLAVQPMSGAGYQPHALVLSMAQKRKLAKGHAVRLKHAHLGFTKSTNMTPVYLTMSQLRKLENAHRNNRGADIQFSSGQQRTMHGRGFFGDLWRGIKSVGSKAAQIVKPVAQMALPFLRERVLPRAQAYGENLLEQNIIPALERRGNLAAERLANRIEGGVNTGLNAVDTGLERVGLGLRKPRGRRGGSMRGAGWFDDLVGGVRSVVEPIARTALPVAASLGARRLLGPGAALLGLGVKQGRTNRRKMTRGGAPFATGSRR